MAAEVDVFLQPPPKEWDASGPRRRSSGGTVGEPKMLARIRALLAKAEATTFVEEADAFTAKAQELMARHAIDAAAVESSAHPVELVPGWRSSACTSTTHMPSRRCTCSPP